jgi:cell division protein FtsL
VGRAATAAAARPTRTAPPPHGTNGRGDDASGEHAVRGRARNVRARAAARRASVRTGPRGRGAAAARISAAVAVPIRVLSAPFARTLRARTAKVLDALLSGRGWIALIGVLLTGIVFFNVDLLQMNRDIARNAERASALKRQNARLRLEVARLGSSERIQEAAAGLGLVLPAPGEVRYLKARPALDARRAAKRITEPDATLVSPAPVVTSPGSTLPSATTTPLAPPVTTTPPATTTPPSTTTPPAATTPPTGAAIPPATTTMDGPATPQATAPGATPQSTTGQAIAPSAGQPAGGLTAPPTTAPAP